MDHPNIDTGMGLERLACILQGVDNLFEVDTVKNIMEHISRIANVTYKTDEKTDVSLRVITDHIRSTVFMVGDGVMPSNEGRGYVLRRLLRRASRHGVLLGINKPFLFEVVETVIRENEKAYPELREKDEYIKKVIRVEEESFAKTVNKGIELLNEILDEIEKNASEKVLSGESAFKLYDTFGFPIDLTQEIVAERSITVDTDAFAKLMDEQRRRAREARAKSNTDAWSDDSINLTNDKTTDFIGYDNYSCDDAKVIVLVKDGERVDNANSEDDVIIVLDKTPFYAESGGQVADTGVITCGSCKIEVYNVTKTATGHFLHHCNIVDGSISEGATVNAQIDTDNRDAIRRSHTAAHLLQAALRNVLGDHVHQAGQLVENDHVRFDFSHFSAMTVEEIKTVETQINEKILSALPVKTFETDIESARKLGAMALFGEKYGDVVRVVDIDGYSIELCGGTHVDNISKIGLFKIISEASVASGVRRIEATVGKGVLNLINNTNQIVNTALQALKISNPADLAQKCTSLTDELRQANKELDSMQQKLANSQIDTLFEKAVHCGSVNLITATFNNLKPDALRMIGDGIKEHADNVVAVLATVGDGKGTMLAVCGKDAIKDGAHAGNIVRETAALIGGKGGGRPDSAMAGISEIFRIDEALAQLPVIVEKMVSKD